MATIKQRAGYGRSYFNYVRQRMKKLRRYQIHRLFFF